MDTSTSLKVDASYEDGSSNTIRPAGIVYPCSAELTYGYGDADSIDVAACQYLQGTVAEVDEPEPVLKCTLIGTAGGDDADTGDIYRAWAGSAGSRIPTGTTTTRPRTPTASSTPQTMSNPGG